MAYEEKKRGIPIWRKVLGGSILFILFWRMWALPMEIARDLASGLGEATGWLGLVVFGIWLVCGFGKRRDKRDSESCKRGGRDVG